MADYNTIINNAGDTGLAMEKMGKGMGVKNVANVYFGIVLAVLLTIFTIWILKKFLLKEGENLWDLITRPWQNLNAKIKAARDIANTGQAMTYSSMVEAKEVADAIYSCFQTTGDDEQSLLNIIANRVKNNADWVAVKGQFGVRDCPKLINKHSGDLEHVISHNLSYGERKQLRSILNKKGISTTI